MDIVVVLELDAPTNVRGLHPDHAPAIPENPVRSAHHAPTEPSGTCGPLTFCGLDTSDMIIAPQPTTHDHPPRWHTCSTCRIATTHTPPAPDAVTAPLAPSAP
ncbi:hypothetical protein [Streptomyces sp. CBMA123]|uniref:hypothetical protein n=1 Tax=Streptomyces sp. CBMA123 TaxID=1896313 RepID=UPI00166202E7|nr:hypothetical protein [Streptomyces sp. CBMA123]MBD0690782.1 hypothetical protein [Streptomyces sp. CBMA123]